MMKNKGIPVIGVPTINGGKWLKRLINSVDYPVNNFIIFNNNGRGLITEVLDNFTKIKHPWIKNIEVCHLPSNLGVPTVWNLIIKSYINSPYWLITQDDIAFTPGLLKKMHEITLNGDIDMVHASNGWFDRGSYDLFVIKESVIKKIGLFDENLSPAYCEDHDYASRCLRYTWDNPKDEIKHYILGASYYHGRVLSTNPTCYPDHASQTKRSDSGEISSEEMLKKINNSNDHNKQYLIEKWGEECLQYPQKYPMGIENIPIDYTKYDIDFIRKKHFKF